MKADLQEVFHHLKQILKRYEEMFTARVDTGSQYHLWSEKEVDIAGRKRNEVYFAGLVIRNEYVGFYYMPVYADEEMKKLFAPELLKTLKGKSCFHIKHLDRDLEKQISDALEKGYKLYQKNGWV